MQRTRILTDTPVRNELHLSQQKTKNKKLSSSGVAKGKSTKRVYNKNNAGSTKTKKKKVCRRLLPDSSSSSNDEESDNLVPKAVSARFGQLTRDVLFQKMIDGESDSVDDVDDVQAEVESEDDVDVIPENLKSDDYIVVKLSSRQNVVHYIAQIVSSENSKIKVKYLEKQKMKLGEEKLPRFFLADTVPIYSVPIKDIVKKLPNPTRCGGTNVPKVN